MKFSVLAHARALKRKETFTGKNMAKKKGDQYIYEPSDCNFSMPLAANSQHFINNFVQKPHQRSNRQQCFHRHHKGTEMTQLNAKKNSAAVASTNVAISHVYFSARVFRTEPCARHPKIKRIHPGGTLPHSLPCPSTVKLKSQCTKVTSTQDTSSILILG